MESGHGKAEAEAEAGGGVNRWWWWWWWCVGDPMKLICRFQAGLEWRHRAVRECAREESDMIDTHLPAGRLSVLHYRSESDR